MEMRRIGFVGVGRMGANMARRLHESGYVVSAVNDAASEVAEALARELGTEAVVSLAEVTRRSDVVITVVPDDAAMREIYEHPGDNLLMDAGNKLFINCATISPGVHIDLARKAGKMGAKMLEAPMASSIPQARAGTLFMMISGDPAVHEEALPLLNTLASTIIYAGPPGNAANLKALVNMVMNINTAALAEGLGLAESLGLDLNLTREVFAKTGANSRVLETDGEDMRDRAHDTYFSAAHAAKDCGIAVELGKAQGLPMVLANATLNQYEELKRRGLGEIDKSGVSELTFKSRMNDHSALLRESEAIAR